jgi:hypothetical protein
MYAGVGKIPNTPGMIHIQVREYDVRDVLWPETQRS